MKAQVLPEIVFIEGQDFNRQEIENIDIHFRLEKLVEDTVLMTEVYQNSNENKKRCYFDRLSLNNKRAILGQTFLGWHFCLYARFIF